jgi:WD40 repeat protein
MRINTKTQLCKLVTFNQLRVVIFHPNYEDILYSATVNDAIRKWNITDGSMLVQQAIPYSVHSMDISPDGTKLVFGTLEGHVGMIDEHLATSSIKLSVHGLTVNHMYYTYPGYYISVGDDAVAVLWNDGTYVTNITSLLNTRLYSCSMNDLYAPFEPAKYMVCFTNVSYTFTYRITNTYINYENDFP